VQKALKMRSLSNNNNNNNGPSDYNTCVCPIYFP